MKKYLDPLFQQTNTEFHFHTNYHQTNNVPVTNKKSRSASHLRPQSDSNISYITVQDSELFNQKILIERLEENNAKVKMKIMATIKVEIYKANLVVKIVIKQTNMEVQKSGK